MHLRLLLTATTTLALALTGCGGDADPAAPVAPSTPVATDAAPTEADPTEAPATEASATAPEGTGDETAPDEPAATGDCAAAGLDLAVRGEGLPDATLDTAAFLLDAAVRCDEQLVTTAATESDTTFFFGNATVGEVFALPEDPAEDPAAWEAMARLLGATTPVEVDGTWAWPAAHGADASEADWQELVDSGLYTQSQVEQLRTGEGYLGWRVGIAADGTWQFMTAGD